MSQPRRAEVDVAARRDSPNCCWSVFEALSTSLKALPMLSLVDVPLTLSFERERV